LDAISRSPRPALGVGRAEVGIQDVARPEEAKWPRLGEHLDGEAEVDATILGFGSDAQKTQDARIALFEAMPDDVDNALDLIDSSPPRAGLELLKRVPWVNGNWRFQWFEARNLNLTGQTEQAQALLDQVAARARELGDRQALGWVAFLRGTIFYVHHNAKEALAGYRDAEGVFADAGLLYGLANAKLSYARILDELSRVHDAEKK
jgi:hypothetical protein